MLGSNMLRRRSPLAATSLALGARPFGSFSGEKASRQPGMSSKRGNKNYYKGNRVRPIGKNTKHGNYVVDAPRDAHALYQQARGDEVHDEYWVPERLPTFDQRHQALITTIYQHQRTVLRPWDAYPKWRAGDSSHSSGWTSGRNARLQHRLPESFEGPLWENAALGLVAETKSFLAQEQCVADSTGWTPLHYAAAFGRDSCITMILPHVDREALDNEGRTAAQLAARSGHFGAVCLLLDEDSSSQSLTEGAAEKPREISLMLQEEANAGFGLRMDERGVVTGYSRRSATLWAEQVPSVPVGGWSSEEVAELRAKAEAAAEEGVQHRRAAEREAVPVGSLLVSVGGTEVFGRTAAHVAMRKSAKSNTPVEFVFQQVRDFLGYQRAKLSEHDIPELTEMAVEIGVPEHKIQLAKTAVWAPKPKALGGMAKWRAPEYVVPDLDGVTLQAYVSRNPPEQEVEA